MIFNLFQASPLSSCYMFSHIIVCHLLCFSALWKILLVEMLLCTSRGSGSVPSAAVYTCTWIIDEIFLLQVKVVWQGLQGFSLFYGSEDMSRQCWNLHRHFIYMSPPHPNLVLVKSTIKQWSNISIANVPNGRQKQYHCLLTTNKCKTSI